IIEDSLRISFFATTQELFDEAILLSIGQGKNDLALHFAERSQARALLDAWSNTLIKELGTNDSNLLDTTIPSLKILQNNIPPDVQVLEYRLTPDTLLIWLIDNQRFLMQKTPISSQELNHKVQTFLESIGAKQLLDFKARVTIDIAAVYDENRLLGNQLYQLLIKPVYRELASDKQVVIIPHGFLHQVPFGALVTGEGHFLDERFVLSKAPSLAILNKSLNWQNPEVKAPNLQFLMIAGDFPSTPSQKEMARRLFTNAIILDKERTNYDIIKAYLNQNPEILYLNVHAVSDPHHPMNSYIELTNNGANGRQKRPKIYGRQLLELNLSNTWLAVLNGCETGIGKIAQGEGVLNIVRIFSLGKVSFVVASLWKNDDHWSAEIMEKFFEDIAHGEDTAEALRHAKLYAMKKLKAEYQFPLPYFWTVFELYQNSWLNQQERFSYK
ncbi:CHAT domain-containing protein, partial [candidate division KSB1 bacterium]|nr:CHAT domain-containing protein [candidate division KSB1 bacterium]